jgi:hypothetical protein
MNSKFRSVQRLKTSATTLAMDALIVCALTIVASLVEWTFRGIESTCETAYAPRT